MTPGARRLLGGVLLLTLAALAGGCATTNLHPWDRDLLAEKKMQYFPYPMVHAVDEHIYFSKEGSTGGEDVAGGGCGCN
jgi:Domain of unknown function (DUF4266)